MKDQSQKGSKDVKCGSGWNWELLGIADNENETWRTTEVFDQTFGCLPTWNVASCPYVSHLQSLHSPHVPEVSKPLTSQTNEANTAVWYAAVCFSMLHLLCCWRLYSLQRGVLVFSQHPSVGIIQKLLHCIEVKIIRHGDTWQGQTAYVPTGAIVPGKWHEMLSRSWEQSIPKPNRSKFMSSYEVTVRCLISSTLSSLFAYPLFTQHNCCENALSSGVGLTLEMWIQNWNDILTDQSIPKPWTAMSLG